MWKAEVPVADRLHVPMQRVSWHRREPMQVDTKSSAMVHVNALKSAAPRDTARSMSMLKKGKHDEFIKKRLPFCCSVS